jgi:DnaA family protein
VKGTPVTPMQQMILELAQPPAPSLDNFFPGRNGAALSAVQELLRGRERFAYFWGAPGGGKTHLLKAFVAQASSQGVQAIYLGADGFDVPAGVSALAADDVGRLDIVGQLALFDAFNALRSLPGPLLAAGDRPPAALQLREDLRTRLGSGLVLQLHPLDDEEKRAALLDQAAGRGLRLGEDIIEHLLRRQARDMGSLVALLEAIDRYSLQTQRPITLPLLREALRGVTGPLDRP